VTILERIPRNELGKLDRVRLNELLAETTGGPKQSSTAGARPFRQSGTAFDLTFTCPVDIDLSHADDWLSHNLEIDLAAATAGQAKTGRRRTPRRFLMRSLLLARELLQAAGAPIFAAPSILTLKKHEDGGDRWNASVQVPFVEHLPRNAYKIAFDGSIDLCKRAALRPLNDENLQSLYATIESELMPALKRIIPSGGSTVPLLRVAHRLGIPYAHLGGAFYQLGWGAKSKRVNCSSSESDAALGSMLASNKFLGSGLLRRAGLPAPMHKRVSSATEAVAAARAIGWPVVIKPVDRERGEGVTVDIADEGRLQVAFSTARKLSRSKRVLVERQVEGCCHRLFVAHGKLLYAVKRLPIGVRGDGSSSIAELVSSEVKAQQRKPPWLRSKIRPLDEMAHIALLSAGFTPSSVPPAGVLAPLRRIESTEWGGIDEEVSASVHPENLAAALRAAELFGLRTAGIDMISPDIAKPWYETGAIINEVNFSPLLGGGEISRRHIADFLRDLIEGEGRIPIEVFVGGNAAMKAAKARWKELTAEGKRCFLTGHEQTLGPAGRELPLAQNGLHARTRALLMHASVEWLIVCVQTDEFLRTGLPFDRVDRLEEIDLELQEHSRKSFLAPEKVQLVTRMVRAAAGRSAQDELM
jgi:cyanophycin synthetase